MGRRKKPLHKHWRDYTEAEINEVKLDKCMDCPYHKLIYSGKEATKNRLPENVYCDYIGITGNRRGCRPEHCNHYTENPTKVNFYGSTTPPIGRSLYSNV